MAEVTLGGDRIGSGNKQKVELHNYGMNSFNQEQDWKSSMAPGVLYPFIKLVGTNHGTFDVDLDALVRTLPTKGPLFGSFKLQLDLYSVPFRLYQGILHNNPIGIGLNMNQVYLPKIRYKTIDHDSAPRPAGSTNDDYQVSTSSLMKYMGLSGAGLKAQPQSEGYAVRKINAVPFLAYYDIFKCYYSNKQEDNAYVIMPEETPHQTDMLLRVAQGAAAYDFEDAPVYADYEPYEGQTFTFEEDRTTNWQWNFLFIINKQEYSEDDILDELKFKNGEYNITINQITQNEYGQVTTSNISGNRLQINLIITDTAFMEEIAISYGDKFNMYLDLDSTWYTSDIVIQRFALKNIDDMRNALLSNNTLGSEFVIGQLETDNWNSSSGTDQTGLPYSALTMETEQGISYNAFDMNGLVLKTYQSDLFNNWLNNDYIDGENGISQLSAVDTSSGSFTMDSLNLAEKIYELLNRVLVSGGTYEDWQEAVYGEGAVRKAETPMYIGGMSSEVMFEEVISSSETKVDGDFQPLGSLGGRGRQTGRKGGNNIHVKMDEPGYIIGIVSLTPRVCYSQGNDWDLTELDTLDDLHKPALDGIGFQNLMVEQFAWWDTILHATQGGVISRHSAGKQTAWINYQTAVDKCYGDFAKTDGYSFMVLNRNYEHYKLWRTGVKDITTYIDPAKYNYAFAVTDLAAQNFWVQIHSKVISRRKMGAQQLPNL